MITHPDKVLFPDDGITKAELAAYYDTVAPFMLRHLRGRPITMERFPAGIGAKGFLQKDVVKGFPAWLKRVEAPKKGGTVHYALAGDRRSLAWLANTLGAYGIALRAGEVILSGSLVPLEPVKAGDAMAMTTRFGPPSSASGTYWMNVELPAGSRPQGRKDFMSSCGSSRARRSPTRRDSHLASPTNSFSVFPRS